MQADEGLLIVDVQRDFCPGGALAVADGDAVIAPLHAFLERERPEHVYASRDWHPSHSRHFLAQGGRWPPHCIRDTPGAEFAPGLRLPPRTVVISKGMQAEEEGYSAFEGRDPEGKSLEELLRRDGVRRIYVGGLTTDYCVRVSVLEARRRGYEAIVLQSAVRAVELEPGDGARALAEMATAGARVKG